MEQVGLPKHYWDDVQAMIDALQLGNPLDNFYPMMTMFKTPYHLKLMNQNQATPFHISMGTLAMMHHEQIPVLKQDTRYMYLYDRNAAGTYRYMTNTYAVAQEYGKMVGDQMVAFGEGAEMVYLVGTDNPWHLLRCVGMLDSSNYIHLALIGGAPILETKLDELYLGRALVEEPTSGLFDEQGRLYKDTALNFTLSLAQEYFGQSIQMEQIQAYLPFVGRDTWPPSISDDPFGLKNEDKNARVTKINLFVATNANLYMETFKERLADTTVNVPFMR